MADGGIPGMTLRLCPGRGGDPGVGRGRGRARSPAELDGAVGLRIVLEGEGGDIVSEAFGSNDSAWELRKQGRGWSLEERTEVDWAMLADLREEATGPAVAGASALDVETGGAQPEKAELTPPSWGQWVNARLEPSVPTAPFRRRNLTWWRWMWTMPRPRPHRMRRSWPSRWPVRFLCRCLGGVESRSGSDGGVTMDGEEAEVVDAPSPSTRPDSAPARSPRWRTAMCRRRRAERMVEQEPQALAEVECECQVLMSRSPNFGFAQHGGGRDPVRTGGGVVGVGSDAELMAPKVRDGAALDDVRT